MSMKNFEILSKLGEGAFSVVYKVRRTSDGLVYALKKVLVVS
jgi:NIMA (never in mitosis gene a)-related kinase